MDTSLSISDNISSEVDELEDKLKIVKELIDENIQKADRMQKEYVSILAIFATVISSFIGSIAFSTSVLENMHKVSLHDASVITLFIGIVLNNILFGMLTFIQTIVGKDNKGSAKQQKIGNIVLIMLLAVSYLFMQ